MLPWVTFSSWSNTWYMIYSNAPIFLLFELFLIRQITISHSFFNLTGGHDGRRCLKELNESETIWIAFICLLLPATDVPQFITLTKRSRA